MFSSYFTALLLAASACITTAFPESNLALIAHTSDLLPRQQSAIPVQICRWWGHGSTEMNNRIFIDGGLQTYRDTKNNFKAGGLSIYFSMSSLDLSQGFKLPIYEDDRRYTRGGSPNPNGEATTQSALFTDGDTTIFKFGGQFIDNNTWEAIPQSEVRPAQVWKFDITRAQWQEVPFTVTDNKKIVRPAGGAYVSAPRLNKAYYLGGVVNPKTDSAFENMPYSGYGVLGDSLLEWDTRTLTFTNLTTPGIAPSAYGNLVYIEAFGAKGVLVLFSGGTATAGKWVGSTDASPNDLSLIHIFDIDKERWYTQKTSGTPPTARIGACAAFVPAPDGTSQNIVFYGGATFSSIALGDMWVLSLPSFTWTQLDDSGEKRLEHTCHVVKGNKLLVVGGRDLIQPSAGDPKKNFTLDGTNWSCLKDGMISLFDLNKLKWVQELPADDEEWRMPEVLTEVIGGTGKGGAEVVEPEAGWDEAELGGLMAVEPGPPEVTDTPKPPADGKDGPPVAVIAGATAGGVVILAIIGAIVYCVRRKRKSADAAAAAAAAEEPKPADGPTPTSPANPPYYDPRTSAYDPAAAAYWANQGYAYDPAAAAAHQGMYSPPLPPAQGVLIAEAPGDTTGAGYYAPTSPKEGEIGVVEAGEGQRKSSGPVQVTELAG